MLRLDQAKAAMTHATLPNISKLAYALIANAQDLRLPRNPREMVGLTSYWPEVLEHYLYLKDSPARTEFNAFPATTRLGGNIPQPRQ